MKWLLHIFDYFSLRKEWLWLLFALLMGPIGYLAMSLQYKEDISDFLPVDEEYKESMAIYQQLSEASRIVVIFRGETNDPDRFGTANEAGAIADPDLLCEAIDRFAAVVEADTTLDMNALQTEVDMQGYLERLRYVHARAPYFIKGVDYERLDSLLTPAHIEQAFAKNRQLLSMPGTGMLQGCLASDPLGIFPLSAGASGQYAATSAAFTSYGGYMMTSDEQMAFAFYDSPFGSTESGRNAVLTKHIERICEQVETEFAGVRVDLLGAPVIAVGNAQRIKKDSALAIGLSVLLIAAILLYSFPRKKDILLIGSAVLFGWLFGMAMLRLFAGEVSAIIMGIGSVIIGIVVNYPLHLLVHQRYTTSVRQTLEEVLSPLVVGNLTTIGAFLALIPLKATALHDLGIFASAMLLGTILFCIFVLPHLMDSTPTEVREIGLPTALKARWTKGLREKEGCVRDAFGMRSWKVRTKSVQHSYAVAVAILIVTGGLYLVSHLAKENLFDSNLSHINYMTAQQRADFAYFEQFQGHSDEPAYLATSAREELKHRLEMWEAYKQGKDVEALCAMVADAAVARGFRAEMFEPFYTMLRTDFSVEAQEATMDAELAQLWPGRFDSASLNSRIAESLSENFDYLGMVCSLIVFVFLWLSFKSLWLALIAFLPMALSWVWIFGLMHLFGLHFNIVNIILASFIFGQGDDYTIFIVEGLVDEHKTGKPILPQFRQSILLSALIMLVGIGVLVFAQHPAMHGLGAVTLVGMACVVVLACVLPPLLFRGMLHIQTLIKSKKNI